MRESIKEAIGSTVQDMLDFGLKSSFTKKESEVLGVKITPTQSRNKIETKEEQKNMRKYQDLINNTKVSLTNQLS